MIIADQLPANMGILKRSLPAQTRMIA